MEPLSPADLKSLVETSRELASEVNLKALLPRILERAAHLTGASAGSIILFDPRKRSLYIAHATGPHAATVLAGWGRESGQGIPIEGSKAGQVFVSGRPLIEDAVARDPDHFKAVDRDTSTPTESMVCVPLDVGGERIGVVQLLNKQGGNFTKRDCTLLDHFASQAAVALRNARLFEDLLAHMGFYTGPETGQGPLELLAELSRPAYEEQLTVLFADLRGFTQLCQVVNRPERSLALLNDFLAMLAGTVAAHGGLVNKFLGDGVMALFRGGAHAVRAVRCADDMVAGFQKLFAGWSRQSNQSLGFLDIGIGIATDTVILGGVGSERVRDFTAIGVAVNLADYLMEQARGGQRILVDRLTYFQAQDEIAEVDGPEEFALKKPGQTVGHTFERYHVRRLVHGSLPAGAAPAAPPPAEEAAPAIFISYSHRDADWLRALQTHLKPYLRSGKMSAWDDRQIRPGAPWREEIEQALAAARVAVLLVSPHFLDSDFILNDELPPLLAAAEREGLRIFWVPLSASSYEETGIGRYQAALDPARPLDRLTPAEQNEALVKLCKQLKQEMGG